MWLPVAHTYSRNKTVAAIKAGKLTNIRLMAGSSGTNPSYPTASKSSPGGWNPAGYGGANGSNPWMTAAQAVATGASSGTGGGTYPLFKMGAACWYFAERLSELGVRHPIGIANTAIGGQRIEEYMPNASVAKCSFRFGSDGATGVDPEPAREWDSVLYAKQVVPFVDMTVKGWAWYQGDCTEHPPPARPLISPHFTSPSPLITSPSPPRPPASVAIKQRQAPHTRGRFWAARCNLWGLLRVTFCC